MMKSMMMATTAVAVFGAAGLLLLLWSLISFKQSFRIGIDTDRPDALITSGIFSFSRNPIYVAFALVLIGEFLIFPNWILLVYVAGFVLIVHRQVLREEDYLTAHYGQEYLAYRSRVRRYVGGKASRRYAPLIRPTNSFTLACSF